ncbi:unnamed protein product [Spirodela intermedia]|uniref:ZF-HD dimerization-type domain-containing protein n=1 Tax=Spirodela intermedia TaxID=51605 RepID=A0A7I8J386_SPIIN|nr:unnamed protein product [Spirodela intermedia]CAA6664509.1 unnamed protein product [Spirodela intermedia]
MTSSPGCAPSPFQWLPGKKTTPAAEAAAAPSSPPARLLQGVHEEPRGGAGRAHTWTLRGVHALPVSVSDAAEEPSALACAACGCHRNFHRRVLRREEREGDDRSSSRRRPCSALYGHRMLVGLGGGLPGRPAGPPSGARRIPQRKGTRGWWRSAAGDRRQRGVFKVWMHNNKHNFLGGPSSRRAATAGGGGGVGGSPPDGSGAAGGGDSEEDSSCRGDDVAGDAFDNGGGGGGGGGDHAVKCPSSKKQCMQGED